MILPDWPSTSKILTPDEKILAAQRLAYDGLASTQGAIGHMGHMEAIRVVFADWRTWGFVVLYMLCTGSQTIQC